MLPSREMCVCVLSGGAGVGMCGEDSGISARGRGDKQGQVRVEAAVVCDSGGPCGECAFWGCSVKAHDKEEPALPSWRSPGPG